MQPGAPDEFEDYVAALKQDWDEAIADFTKEARCAAAAEHAPRMVRPPRVTASQLLLDANDPSSLG
jgi:hypothetical protein